MSVGSCRLCTSWREERGEWLVILAVVVALAAGWGVRVWAENSVERYVLPSPGADPEQALYVAAPFGWLASWPEAAALRLRDVHGGGVPATLEVRAIAVGGARSPAEAVALEADALALRRAKSLTAYRTLEADDAATFHGQPALRVSYVFVVDRPDPFRQHLPTVVLGEDLLAYEQGHVLIFSLQAAEDDFDRLRPRFERVLNSARLGPIRRAGAMHRRLRRAVA